MSNTENPALSVNNSNAVQTVKPVQARRPRPFLKTLTAEVAHEMLSIFLNDYPGTLTMRKHKEMWCLTFSYESQTIKVQHKSLAEALRNLTTKAGLLTPKTIAV